MNTPALPSIKDGTEPVISGLGQRYNMSKLLEDIDPYKPRYRVRADLEPLSSYILDNPYSNYAPVPDFIRYLEHLRLNNYIVE